MSRQTAQTIRTVVSVAVFGVFAWYFFARPGFGAFPILFGAVIAGALISLVLSFLARRDRPGGRGGQDDYWTSG